jgi:REP element-mobilizing transposase RayT
MPDHVHLIFMPLEDEKHETFSFEEIVGSIKGASSHSINKALKRSGTVWQDESFDHVVRHADSLEKKIEYVRQNPVRKGLVSKPEDYPWLCHMSMDMFSFSIYG